MVSEDWKHPTIWWRYTVQCQEQSENKMDTQMSKFLVTCMKFQPGLFKIQDGGEFPIGSHCNVVTFRT